MYLECFYRDVVPQGANWVWSVANPKCFVVGQAGIEERPGDCVVSVKPLSIVDQLETIAEEMLARAADLNKPLSRDEILRRYEACPEPWHLSDTELDAPLGRFLQLRGREVAVPVPEYLGIHACGPGVANLILYNLRTVIPVISS